jgi:hypothetical protein
MNQQTFEQHFAAELQKFGCEYTVTSEDVMREFAALDVRAQAVELDPEDLALAIVNNINEAGIMELIHSAMRTAVLDMLAEKSGTDREALFAEMLQNGRDQEVLHE